jgi:Na+-translocating ferredoxin:NAD+ oxidoreductase RnfA subunit
MHCCIVAVVVSYTHQVQHACDVLMQSDTLTLPLVTTCSAHLQQLLIALRQQQANVCKVIRTAPSMTATQLFVVPRSMPMTSWHACEEPLHIRHAVS